MPKKNVKLSQEVKGNGKKKKRKSIRREIENENKNEWFGRTIRFYFS